MLANKEKFKKQCEEYNEFYNNIKNIIKDYCILYNKKSPYHYYDENEEYLNFQINNNKIQINWVEEETSFGSTSQIYCNLDIPLDFYDNLTDYQKLKKDNEENIKLLDDELRLKTKEYNEISNKISELKVDAKNINNLNIKHNLNINNTNILDKIKELDIKKNEITKNIEELKNKIFEIKKVIS